MGQLGDKRYKEARRQEVQGSKETRGTRKQGDKSSDKSYKEAFNKCVAFGKSVPKSCDQD